MARLLLIEDERILRENTCELLEIYGFECKTARNGKEGLEAASTVKPDLIICDIMLPYLTGFQVKEELNKHEDLALIPIIFLSAKAERMDLRQGMDLGAADYITKPFKIAELVSSVNSRLEQTKNIQTAVEVKLLDAINDFVRISKHECNTPLNGIINLSGMLTAELTDQPEIFGKALKSINISGKRLFKTINNLLDLIRLRHYNIPVDQINTLTDINKTIERIIDERTAYYKCPLPITISLNCQESIYYLQEDLDIIIFEVIDNLFKFSVKGSTHLELEIKTEGIKRYMILTTSNSVSSHITLSETDIAPFRQYNRDKLEQQGSGMGLYLTMKLLEKYLGSIKIDTKSLQLFRVILTFPLRSAVFSD